MKNSLRLLLILLSISLAWPAVQARQAATAGAPPQAAAEAPQETWEQYQGADAEQFLLKARIRSMRNLGTGVTLPQKAELELNGVTHSAVWKTIDDKKHGVTQLANGSEINFQDSWQLEVAAYHVDLIIGLKMTPATVERNYNGKAGSMQWWVQSAMSEADRRKNEIKPPDVEKWNQTYLKMVMFDNLISNVDRHLNNILVTKDFDLRLIDHSRSFRQWKELRETKLLTRFSRSLLDGIKKLEYQDLRKRIGRYVTDEQIRGLLARRDLILKLADKLVAEKGEAAVIYP
jgi:hypothetical protein